jgi:hypothetical protein
MPRSATQQFLEFDQIREGVIILKNKALRGILMVSSLNFALKPEDEKDALIYSFQEFLNSLDFPLQFYVRSRKINITGYIEKLKQLETKQPNELLQTQTTSYRQFIGSLVSQGTIMTKNFYCIVPFAISEVEGSARSSLISRTPKVALTEEVFQRAKTQLWQRMEFTALGLKRLGLKAVPLTTPESVELLWTLHHPKEAEVGYFPEIPPELL